MSEFFNGAVILITGGTGFLGKLLVEKLIRTFNIECIYLLVRNKNNQTVEERMKSYVEETVSITIVFIGHMSNHLLSFTGV